jgi:cell division septation protein DedD
VTSAVKERLTGAFILIVAVVLIVPELFSGPAREQSVTDAPDAQSADAGPPLRSYTMDLGDSGAKAQAQGQAALAPEPAAAPAEIPAASAAPKIAAVEPETPPAPVLPPPALPQPVASVATTAAPVVKPATGTPPALSRGWWVQLGSFSARANADRLGETLSKAGYAVQVSPTTANGKELFRVRAGPVADREAAVALQGRLSAAGHKGTLVAPR